MLCTQDVTSLRTVEATTFGVGVEESLLLSVKFDLEGSLNEYGKVNYFGNHFHYTYMKW